MVVHLRRGVEEFLALSLASAPVWNLLASSLLAFDLVLVVMWPLLFAATILAVEYAPEHEAVDAWRFGGYTFVGFAAVALAVGHGTRYTLADNPVVALVAWVVVAAVALALVARRRRAD